MLVDVNGDDDNDNDNGGPPERTEVVAYQQAASRRTNKKLGRYTLERQIAVGGMAEIWLAITDGSGNKVVVKRIKPEIVRDAIRQGGDNGNNVAMEMFVREARLLASLEHENIVQVYEFGMQPSRRAGELPEHFIVMEVLDGLSLRDLALRLWAAKRPLPIEAVVRIVAEACRGLEHAHRLTDERGQPANLVHRDISPDNIFVTTSGHTKLLDFGIAKREDWSNLTVAGELKGKVPYMAPEQLKGLRVDGRTDLFAVGVVLYWLLAGRRPFDGPSDVFTMKAILDDDPTPLRTLNPRVPMSVVDVVMSCLAKEPDARISSAAVLHDALSMVLLSARGAPPNISDLVQSAMTLTTPGWEIVPDIAASPVQSWSTSRVISNGRAERRVPPSFDSGSVDPSTEFAPDISRRVAELVANKRQSTEASSAREQRAPLRAIPVLPPGAMDDVVTIAVVNSAFVGNQPTAPSSEPEAAPGPSLPDEFMAGPLAGDELVTMPWSVGSAAALDLPRTSAAAVADVTLADMPRRILVLPPVAASSSSSLSSPSLARRPPASASPARRRRRRWQRLVPPLLAGVASALIVLLGLSYALGLWGTTKAPVAVVAVVAVVDGGEVVAIVADAGVVAVVDAGVAVVVDAGVAVVVDAGVGVVVDAGVADAVDAGAVEAEAVVEAVDVDVEPPTSARKKPRSPRKAKAVGNGFLLIKATPWAKVTIDGVAEGTTPLPALPLLVGRHRVRLEREKVVKTRLIDVVRNKTVVIQIDMREP